MRGERKSVIEKKGRRNGKNAKGRGRDQEKKEWEAENGNEREWKESEEGNRREIVGYRQMKRESYGIGAHE